MPFNAPKFMYLRSCEFCARQCVLRLILRFVDWRGGAEVEVEYLSAREVLGRQGVFEGF